MIMDNLFSVIENHEIDDIDIDKIIDEMNYHKLVCYNILTKFVADNYEDISVGQIIDTLDYLDSMCSNYKNVLKFIKKNQGIIF